MKNTHEEVLLLVKLTLLKVTLFHGCFSPNRALHVIRLRIVIILGDLTLFKWYNLSYISPLPTASHKVSLLCTALYDGSSIHRSLCKHKGMLKTSLVFSSRWTSQRYLSISNDKKLRSKLSITGVIQDVFAWKMIVFSLTLVFSWAYIILCLQVWNLLVKFSYL